MFTNAAIVAKSKFLCVDKLWNDLNRYIAFRWSLTWLPLKVIPIDLDLLYPQQTPFNSAPMIMVPQYLHVLNRQNRKNGTYYIRDLFTANATETWYLVWNSLILRIWTFRSFSVSNTLCSCIPNIFHSRMHSNPTLRCKSHYSSVSIFTNFRRI